MKKTIILAVFAFMLLALPSQTRAGFQLERLIDPACLIICENEPNVVNNTNTNSNNVNSNVNSPNATVVTNNTGGTPAYTYDSNNDNTTGNALGASCYAINTRVNVGDSVIWRASPYGGNGNYNVSWSGSNGLSGSGTSVTTTYNSQGAKNASITVISAGQTITRNCSSVEVYDYNYNNNNNNNYDYNNYGSLIVSCYPVRSTADVGQSVVWRASASGGNGSYYVTWSGTEGLNGTGLNLSKTYNYAGSKSAYVTVSSGGQSISRTCSNMEIYDNYNSNYNNNYYNNDNYNNNYYSSNLVVSCSASATFAPVGTRVVWQAYVTGGNGNYYYTWSGTDNLNGYNRNIEVNYNGPGVKIASLTVRSGGQTISQTCTNSVTVGAPIAGYNQYNQYTPPTYVAPTKTVVKYVEKAPVKEKTPVVAAAGTSLGSIFSLSNVPWGWVGILVILVLLFVIFYLIYNAKKI